MESQQDIKRQYLRAQILQAGYDPQDFGEYLANQASNKNADISIDQWTLNELKKIVSQFKQLRKKKQSKSIIHSQPQPENIKIKSKIHAEDIKQSGKYQQINLQTKQQIYSQTINCQTISPSSLLLADVEINIIKYQKKQGGMFEKSYVVYFVSTPFLKKTVERRYNDFVWLRETLQKLHPGLPIPPVAKKGQFRRYDDKHLIKRMIILNMFLNKMLQIPEIKGDQIFQNFLKFDDFVMFQKFKSQYSKLDDNINLNKVKNIKGSLTLSIDPKINKFLIQSQRNLNESYLDIKKIFKQFKGAATCLQGAVEHLKEVSRVCLILDDKQRKFKQQNQMKYQSTNMFTIFNQISQKLSQILMKEARIFRKQMYSLVKYQYLNNMNMIQFFDKLVALQRQYQQGKNHLLKKKQKLYQQGNMSKWGVQFNNNEKPPKAQALKVMLPKQSAQVNKMKQIYALYNFQLYEELNRHYLRNNFYIAKYLQKIAQLSSRTNSQSMIIWVDLLTKILAMKQGKSIQHSVLKSDK